jgi:hypothetical protein
LRRSSRSGSGAGWDTGRLTLLRAFRDDPSPLEAAAAQFTFPPDEGTPPDAGGTDEG